MLCVCVCVFVYRYICIHVFIHIQIMRMHKQINVYAHTEYLRIMCMHIHMILAACLFLYRMIQSNGLGCIVYKCTSCLFIFVSWPLARLHIQNARQVACLPAADDVGQLEHDPGLGLIWQVTNFQHIAKRRGGRHARG